VLQKRLTEDKAHTEQDDFGFKVTPFERARLVREINSSGVLEEKQSLPHHCPFCNTTKKGVHG
jgi:hypothetical protein